MRLVELFLDQLKSEENSTRRVLQQVPEGRNDWKPHEKSMPLGYLSALVAGMPGWIEFMINRDELDIASTGAAKFKPEVPATNRDLINSFEGSMAKARAALDGRPAATVEDVRALAEPVLRHRVLTNFHAEAEGVDSRAVVAQLLRDARA